MNYHLKENKHDIFNKVIMCARYNKYVNKITFSHVRNHLHMMSRIKSKVPVQLIFDL
jgi:hypothetical protein